VALDAVAFGKFAYELLELLAAPPVVVAWEQRIPGRGEWDVFGWFFSCVGREKISVFVFDEGGGITGRLEPATAVPTLREKGSSRPCSTRR
jgi:hypothetical protein